MDVQAIKKPKFSRKTYAIMALVGSILTLMCTGGGIYGVSNMMVVPMAEKFGVEVSQTQLYYSMFLIGVITGGFFGPPIVAKLKLGGSAVLGGVLGAIGLALMGFSNSLTLFYIGAVFTGWPICFAGPALLQTAISKWFYAGRATIMGLVGLTEAIGTTIISNVTAALLDTSAGLSAALIGSAAFVLVGNLIAGLFLFKGSPEDYGWTAIGAENLASSDNEGTSEIPGLTRQEAFKKPAFWAFLLGMSVLNIGYGLVQPQLSAYTQFVGFSAAQAAIVVSVWSWGKSISKVIYGFLCDRFGMNIGFGITVLFAIATGIMYVYADSFPMLIVCAAGMGAVGGLTGSGTLGVSRMCGQRDFLKLALLPHGFNGCGNILGPLLFSAVFTGDAAGYQTAGWLSVAFLTVYFVDIILAMRPKNLFEAGNTLTAKK